MASKVVVSCLVVAVGTAEISWNTGLSDATTTRGHVTTVLLHTLERCTNPDFQCAISVQSGYRT